MELQGVAHLTTEKVNIFEKENKMGCKVKL